jgi:hypothetical protein
LALGPAGPGANCRRGDDETVLRHPLVEPRRHPWRGIATGALGGTALAILALVLGSALQLW